MTHRTQDDEKIDGSAVFRHVQKLYSEREYRQRYQKLDYWTPHEKQRAFMNDTHTYAAAVAGNRSGKSTVAAAYCACVLTDTYPPWFTGWRPKPSKETRIVWTVAPSGTTSRDVQQALLLGGLSEAEIGSGFLPLSSLRSDIILSRGVGGQADRVLINRSDGGLSAWTQKSWEQDRSAMQGQRCTLIWVDEDDVRGEILFPEWQARIVGGGRLIQTCTPLAGLTSMRRFFKEQAPDRATYRWSLFDNTFISRADAEAAAASYPERERATRVEGFDMPGEGAVFNFSEDTYLHDLDPSTISPYAGWKFIAGVDWSHGGLSTSSHPFAYCCCAVSPSGVVFVVEAFKIKQQLPAVHAARIKEFPLWDAPVSFGGDGNQRANASTGLTFVQLYRDLGIPLLHSHATLPDGSVSIDGAIALMESMFASGKMKIARHLHDLRSEIQNLHYDKQNRYVAADDDIFSALRYAVMSLRFAKPYADIIARDHEPRSSRRRRIPNRVESSTDGPYEALFGSDYYDR